MTQDRLEPARRAPIRERIQSWLFESEPAVRELDGGLVPPERIRAEYSALLGYLLRQHADGAHIGLRLTRASRYLLCILACMHSGRVFVPLRVEWPQARTAQIDGIVRLAEVLDDARVEEIIGRGAEVADAQLPALRAGDPLYCLFTSGTTGAPKGVIVSRGAYENFLAWVDGYFGAIGPEDRLLNSTDYTFDVSLAEVALALTRRAQFCCSNFRDDLFTLLTELHERRISVVATVPNNFTMLLDERLMERADLGALRHALIAGSRLPVKLVRQFRRFLPHARVHNCYGPTEATIYCIARELDGDEAGFVVDETVSVGMPLPGCTAVIVDEEMRRVQAPARGELLIGGAQLMDGYVANAEATRAALVDIEGQRFYRTGDVAFQDGSGQFFVTGRNDDTVKVSGQRVNLSDIDGYVQRMPFVRSCATIAIEDELRGALLVLYVVPAAPIGKEDAFDALREILPRHQMPHDIRFVASLPLNNSGKISKRALVEQYGAGKA